jgi:hypothetical protein
MLSLMMPSPMMLVLLMKNCAPQRLTEYAGLLEIPGANAMVSMLKVLPAVVMVMVRTVLLQEARRVERGRAALHEGGEDRALERLRR